MTPVDVLMGYWRRHERVQRRLEEIRTEQVPASPVPGCGGCRLAMEAGPKYLRMHRMTEPHRRTAA